MKILRAETSIGGSDIWAKKADFQCALCQCRTYFFNVSAVYTFSMLVRSHYTLLCRYQNPAFASKKPTTTKIIQ